MKNLTHLVLVIALFSACNEEKIPPPVCGEYTPECELMKDYVYFEVDSIFPGTNPIDALGIPLVENEYYVTSTQIQAPVMSVHPFDLFRVADVRGVEIRDTIVTITMNKQSFQARLFMPGRSEFRVSRVTLGQQAGIFVVDHH